jgi:hypothetical protein
MHLAYRVDADFAEEVLRDLYSYRRKRLWVARALSLPPFGIIGAHRFYLGRPLTGLLMLVTFGGALLWWVVDLFLVRSMVEAHAAEQERRRREGLPPLEMSFMPPLWKEVLERPPEWTHHWRVATRFQRGRRFAGDLLVLVVTGVLLGWVAPRADVWEAVVAVLVLVVIASAGAAIGRVAHLPVLRGLVLWSHRLRLFYYFTPPGSPLALLFRPFTGTLLAPFRRRARAEAGLYLQLGAVFTLAFLLLDFGEEILGPIVMRQGLPELSSVLWLWVREAVVTFLVIYAFATPLGAVLTLYLLTFRTHTVPRMLSGLAVAAIVAGLLL